MPDASPTKWHLAHTTWFFETFVLNAVDPRRTSVHAAYAELFNSYYQSVGPRYPRAHRGLLSRPSLEEVRAYRRQIDAAMSDLLRGDPPEAVLTVIETGLHHEQQHQELVLTDIKHALSANPADPVYRPGTTRDGGHPPLEWRSFSGGVRSVGHDGDGFCFDNELPRHPVYVAPFALASRCVTVEEFVAFIEDGGYRRPELWLSDGFATAQAEGWEAPLYWSKRDGSWTAFTLSGRRRLEPAEPVCHLSFYEADAHARWAGARLPTEAEWEVASSEATAPGTFAESGDFHPAIAPVRPGLVQMFGDVWEWTSSAYAPYPGYRVPAGAIGEYNGKFMCNQLVLRGGSCATPRSHVRPTYRNFFYPGQRWQFSGMRLARDAV